MLNLSYTDRDFESVFNSIKTIMETIEPQLEVSFDKSNVESIIARVIAGCVDALSYNQDANILEAFPSTAKNPRAVFDLLSIVGYTPKTARCCKLDMSLWNPNFTGSKIYEPFSKIFIDNKQFYCPDEFICANGTVTQTKWYQGKAKTPDKRNTIDKFDNFIESYYPNLSVNTIKNRLFKLPEEHNYIDSRTVRIYTEDGTQLKYIENPYLTNINMSSFSILPSVNKSGYSLMFSKDVAGGSAGENFYYFYVVSEEQDVGNSIKPDFSTLDNADFSFSYNVENHKAPETANDARENIVYEFGWRDTPKAIITKYDAERALLQNFDFISAVDVRDGTDYSKCDSSNFNVRVFCKVNENYERILDETIADGLINKLHTYFNQFKMLPLNFDFRIDDIVLDKDYDVTQLYYWYPDITIYLKEQVNSQEAAAILNAVNSKLQDRYKTLNVNFNEIPRIVDIIETVQNASETILYLDIDGVTYIDKENNKVNKNEITCSYSENITIIKDSLDYQITLNTKNNTRNIQYNTIKIFNKQNELVGYDNGEGLIIPSGIYLDGQGEINYETGVLKFKLIAPLEEGNELRLTYKQETPTYCEYIDKINATDGIKIALESLR